ncbi:MAG: hypothetical protein PHV18_04190 [Lachnospiraceae bacterium]|nr:hypothetical protein [Lachnospiraceae bacterium]
MKKVKEWFSRIGTLNIILAFVFGFFIYFNAQMLQIYREIGSIPETYACAVIAATIGECGICGWIRTNKDKSRERKQELEDRDYKKKERREDPAEGGSL